MKKKKGGCPNAGKSGGDESPGTKRSLQEKDLAKISYIKGEGREGNRSGIEKKGLVQFSGESEQKKKESHVSRHQGREKKKKSCGDEGLESGKGSGRIPFPCKTASNRRGAAAKETI